MKRDYRAEFWEQWQRLDANRRKSFINLEITKGMVIATLAYWLIGLAVWLVWGAR